VLITGAGGYVGTTLTPALAEGGWQVLAVDTFADHPAAYDFLAGLPGVEVATADMRTVTAGQLAGVDSVVHLAGLSNDASTASAPELAASVNVWGAVNQARIAKQAGVSRFLFASSASVYGRTDGGTMHEASPTNPLSLYASQKLCVERHLAELADDGFKVVCLRKATLFGTSYTMRHDLVLNSMVRTALTAGYVPVGGGGRQNRPLVHIRDAAQVYELFLETRFDTLRAFDVVNVARENVSIGGLALHVSDALQVPCRFVGNRVDDRSYHVSGGRLRELTGFEPKISVSEGILELAQSIRKVQRV
jgi:nucleoside-diphosphate-sugar epimerase